MASPAHVTPTRVEPVAQTIARLERFVARMEERYECSAEEMERVIDSGAIRETKEVCKWLMEARVLRDLKQVAGVAAG